MLPRRARRVGVGAPGWQADRLCGPEENGWLSLDALAGTEWVLRGWGFNDPAPSEPEVTLTYQDGRFAGTSGCNSYFGSATAGEMPGDLAVGPTGGTRMACPEPQSAVEARFLTQLGGAKKFGFLLGQLAVSYQTEGGVGARCSSRVGRPRGQRSRDPPLRTCERPAQVETALAQLLTVHAAPPRADRPQ